MDDDRFAAVPDEARPGLAEVWERAVGAGPFTDEHAVVWTVFSHLLQSAQAGPCWRLFSDENAPWPAALLWGGEALGEQAEYVREQLLSRSPDWAPDVLLEHWPAGLVIVVARWLKPNRDERDRARWPRWLDDHPAFADPVGARASGRIDLVRAWRLGWEMAGPRRFTLVNLVLVPERAQQKAATDLFRSSLLERSGASGRRFEQLTWHALLGALPTPWPDWLVRFAHARRLR